MELQRLLCMRRLFGAIVLAVLSGCGGGGGGSPGSTTAPPGSAATMLVGTVATGKALAGASIQVMDAAGRSVSATAGADGRYAVDVSVLTAPLVLKASGSRSGLGVTLVSAIDALVAASANVVNITPLTTAVAANLSATGQAADLSPVTDRERIVSSLLAADAAVQAQAAPMMQAIGVSGSPIRTPFLANGSGYDKLYDNIVVGRTAGNKLIIGPAAFRDGQNVNNCPQGGSYAGCAPVYADTGTATITNPNLCGSDIATGVGIPCDPTRAISDQPSSPITGGGIPITGPGISGGGSAGAGSQPPASPSQPAGSAYAGFYTGSYGGDDAGSFSLTVDAAGVISGVGVSSSQGGAFAITGVVGPTGSVGFGTAGGDVSASYQGTIDASGALTGTWAANPPASAAGNFSGHRQ
jgi:hypothetical protein